MKGSLSKPKTTPARAAGPRSVLRVVEILHTLARSPDGMSLAVLCEELAIPKTSLLTLLRALGAGNYVQHARGIYTLSTQSLQLAAAIDRSRLFPGTIRPIVERLARESGETVIYGVLPEGRREVLYLDVIVADKPLRFTSRPGDTRPLYCSSAGKALLAFLPAAAQAEYVASTRFIRYTKTTTDRAALSREIAEIRRHGVARTFDGFVEGVSGLASPGFNERGAVYCAIAVTGPSARVTQAESRIETLVRQAGEELSRASGYQGPYPPPVPSGPAPDAPAGQSADRRRKSRSPAS